MRGIQLHKIAAMQDGRPVSPRAQDSMASNESRIRNETERGFANVESSNSELPSDGINRNQGWQANFNEPINLPINLPPISRSARASNPIITSQPHSTRRQGTLGEEENENLQSLSNHPRLTSDIPPIVPPRPKNTLSYKSKLTTMSSNRISPSPNRSSNTSQSSGPGRGLLNAGGTLISQSQSINLPNVSPPPIPTTTSSNMSNINIPPSNTNHISSHGQGALSNLSNTPINISLISPRPGPDRVQNLYVDAPLKSNVISRQNDLLT